MADIYNRATATIVVCDQKDANNHLNVSKISSPSHSSGVSAPLHRRKITEKIRCCHHSTRGWTFQERLFSRRRIYFFDHEIVFHCSSDMFTLDGETPVMGRCSMVGKNIHQYMRDHFRSTQGDEDLEWPKSLTKLDYKHDFFFWMKLVEEYSQKSLSVQSDILDACSGILAAFEQTTSWKIEQGMSLPLLDLAIQWIPQTKVVRRCSTGSEGKYPSWSWLGWKGGVRFDLTRNYQKNDLPETRLQDLTLVGLSDSKIVHRTTSDKADWLERTTEFWDEHKPQNELEDDTSIQKPPDDCDIYLEFSAHYVHASQLLFGAGRLNTFKAVSYDGPSTSLSFNESTVCGALYGILPNELLDLKAQLCELEIILLADRKESIHLPTAQLYGDDSSETSQHYEPTDEADGVNSIMLIQSAGNFWERVAVGEITRLVWDNLMPAKKKFRLK
jgi:hypothetical protein